MAKAALLIIGYDGYMDVWKHYFELLNKYWKDRPPTYLATSLLHPKYQGVKVFPAGAAAEWSDKARNALLQIDADYIILLLEDFFTTQKVDNNRVMEVIDLMDEHHVTFCRLLDQKKMKGKTFANQKNLKVIPTSDLYGLNLQPAIWKKETLLSFIKEGSDNPWMFEFKLMDLHIHNKNKIDSIQDNRNILAITHGIVQSKYLPKCIKIFKRQHYEFDLTNRSVFSTKDNMKYRLKCFVNFHSPKWSKRYLKAIGRRMGVEFVSDRILGGKTK